jgi:DUF3102 family protein
MTTTALAAPTQTTAQKLKRAKAIYFEIIQIEGSLKQAKNNLLVHAFALGQILTELKEEIGHGNWLMWLPSNFPELGSSDDMRIKNAQRCMNFHRDNTSNSRNSSNLNRRSAADFGNDSVRKFMWGYVPAKERPQLEGDESVSNPPHYLSFVNHLVKWYRQLGLGHIATPPVAQFRKETETVIRILVEIGGKEWALALVEE